MPTGLILQIKQFIAVKMYRYNCECAYTTGIKNLADQLQRAESLLSADKAKGLIKVMQNALAELKRQHQAHLQIYADNQREMIELVKMRELNVGPTQKRLRTVPFLMGSELEDYKERAALENSSKKKKKRKIKV